MGVNKDGHIFVGQEILAKFMKSWSYIPLHMLREVWERTPLLRGPRGPRDK